MGREVLETITSIVTAIIGLAILSVLVSSRANTSGVIRSASSGLAEDISAAVSPVTGSGGLSISNPFSGSGIMAEDSFGSGF